VQTGVDYDDKNKKTSIFKIQGEGKTWAKGVDKEQGNYDYLVSILLPLFLLPSPSCLFSPRRRRNS
jgi:hypothetical protein